VQKRHLPVRVAVLALAACTLPPLTGAGLSKKDSGAKALYVGGTIAAIPARSRLRLDCTGAEDLKLNLPHSSLAVPWRDINTLEYGVRVNRRYLEAILISPLFLAAKKRIHFLTLGFADQDGRQQAVILLVGKDEIRPILVSLEARTGRKVEFQDEEARKAGKG
jgi:hypothetical protein